MGGVDPGRVERGFKYATGVKLHAALCLQPPGLPAEIRILQTQNRICQAQGKAALPPAFGHIGSQGLALGIAGQAQRRLNAGGIQVAMYPCQIQARAIQVDRKLAIAPLAITAKAPGVTQVDFQRAEIGVHAIAHHRTGQVGQRQAILIEPAGLLVGETERAQQTFARLTFKHAGKRQISVRRIRRKLSWVDSLTR